MLPGLEIRPEWISAAEESYILAAVGDDMPGKRSVCGRSRVERYGPGVQRSGYRVGHRIEEAIPSWLVGVTDRVSDLMVPDAITLAWYQVGDGVRPHADRPECGEVIAVVSLLSDATMRFLPWSRDKTRAVTIEVPRRSLLVMRGEARWDWLHEISPVVTPRIAVVLRQTAV